MAAFVMTPAPAPTPAGAHALASDGPAVLSGTAPDSGLGDDIETLLERFLVSILALAGAQAGAVRVWSDDGQQLRLVAQIGLPAQVQKIERTVARNCGICGVAALGDTLAWVDDIDDCARHSQHAYFGQQCRRVLAISLTHGGQVLGIYNLFFEADTQLDPATESMLSLIGQLLGLTLHQARVERERIHMTVQKERREMVSEVHDAIAQTLTYAKMRLPLLNQAMASHDEQKSVRYLNDVKRAVGEAQHNLRELMTFFRTRMDPLGLLHALRRIADGFCERTGVALELRNSAGALGLDETQETQVFHIIQEALANIAKHAMARHARLSIRRTERALEFLVEDDGKGFAASVPRSGAEAAQPHDQLGLGVMQARAQRLGAIVEVGPMGSGGTRVRLEIPLAEIRGRSPA